MGDALEAPCTRHYGILPCGEAGPEQEAPTEAMAVRRMMVDAPAAALEELEDDPAPAMAFVDPARLRPYPGPPPRGASCTGARLPDQRKQRDGGGGRGSGSKRDGA